MLHMLQAVTCEHLKARADSHPPVLHCAVHCNIGVLDRCCLDIDASDA